MSNVGIQHKDLTDPQVHEPKGVSTAAVNKVYFADGEGSGEWEEITPSKLSFSQASFDTTTLTGDVSARTLTNSLSGTLDNLLTDASNFVGVNKNCKELGEQVKNCGDMIAVLKSNIAELNRVVQAIKTQLNNLTFTAEA